MRKYGTTWQARTVPDQAPTCVDDNADDGLRVPDGAAAKQQVLLVQPGLLPVVVHAVEECLSLITLHLHAPPIPSSTALGREGWTLGWKGEWGSWRGPLASVASTRASMELVPTGHQASRSISRACCLLCQWALGNLKRWAYRSLPRFLDAGLLKCL